jgi:hypothetical protein
MSLSVIAYSRVCIVDVHTHTSTGTSFLVAQRYKKAKTLPLGVNGSLAIAAVSRISSSSSSLLGALFLMKLKANGKHDGTEGSLEQQIALLREKLQKQEEMITDLKLQKEVSHTNKAAPEKSANKSAKGEGCPFGHVFESKDVDIGGTWTTPALLRQD